MPISPTLIAALAAGALAAPIAQAKPSDVYTPVAEAAARAQSKQHQRAPHARDAINAPGATVVDSAS